MSQDLQYTTKKSTGFSITCGKIAATEALFKMEGMTIIQRYCNNSLSSTHY